MNIDMQTKDADKAYENIKLYLESGYTVTAYIDINNNYNIRTSRNSKKNKTDTDVFPVDCGWK